MPTRSERRPIPSSDFDPRVNHIAWVEPTSGIVIYQSPEDQEPKNAA
jgi:hypothetical protein